MNPPTATTLPNLDELPPILAAKLRNNPPAWLVEPKTQESLVQP